MRIRKNWQRRKVDNPPKILPTKTSSSPTFQTETTRLNCLQTIMPKRTMQMSLKIPLQRLISLRKKVKTRAKVVVKVLKRVKSHRKARLKKMSEQKEKKVFFCFC